MSKKKTYTPRPWLDSGHDGKSSIIIESPEWGVVAKVFSCGSLSIDSANARLIAAAPDLLEALEVFLGWFDDNFSDQNWLDPETDDWRSFSELPEYINATKSIAKAKGE